MSYLYLLTHDECRGNLSLLGTDTMWMGTEVDKALSLGGHELLEGERRCILAGRRIG